MAPRRLIRRAFTYLELEVSLALFAIGLSGLGPLVVMQSRQLQTLEERVSDDVTYHISPSAHPWARKLGAAGTLGTDEPPTPPVPPVTLIDDGDTQYAETNPGSNDWASVSSSSAYEDDSRTNDCDLAGDLARWTFTITRRGWYQVHVTFPPAASYASNAPYRVYNGSSWLGTYRVDQRYAPSGPVFLGRPWRLIGTFLITAPQLRITLRDDATGARIAADAVRIVPVLNTVEIQSVAKSVDDEITVIATVTPP